MIIGNICTGILHIPSFFRNLYVMPAVFLRRQPDAAAEHLCEVAVIIEAAFLGDSGDGAVAADKLMTCILYAYTCYVILRRHPEELVEVAVELAYGKMDHIGQNADRDIF